MNEEILQLAIEIVKELIKMSVDEINEVRTEWLGACKKEKKINIAFIEKFVNYVCDYAINKVTHKTA